MPREPVTEAAEPAGGAASDRLLDGLGVVFESLGRALICLGPDFRVVHASAGLDELLGGGAVEAILGRDAAEVFGDELFGPGGTVREALLAGERREGWGATVDAGAGRSRWVSMTAAPVTSHREGVCDPRVAFVAVLRPAEESQDHASAGPTLFAGMVARSAAMLHIFRFIEHLRESDATVLITGESGTGKELVARAIHLHSPRRGRPFVAVNCGALPGELLESELFGHVRGAFTGAVRDRVGRFELAAGGTIFLDEVGDLPLHLQVKLLRVLQEKTFERVGESQTRSADARVVAATNRQLRQAVAAGEFRDDLYYRLRVVPIEVPPLRQRREDVEPLAHHLLARVGRRHDRSLKLSPDAMRAMLRYPWPGNVRELENALEYAVAVCRGQTVHAHDLPVEIRELEPGPPHPGAAVPVPAPAAPPASVAVADTGDPERRRIAAALEAHRWRRAETARALGISRTTLWRKMRELGLDG